MPRAAARRRPKSTLSGLSGALRAPFPGFIPPCLATPADHFPARGEWVHEIKHDGYRAQAHLQAGKSSVFTRNGYDWTARFKPIADALQALGGHDLVLDGEIVVMDDRGASDFHLLQDELAKKAPEQLTYLVFDLLYLDGFDLRGSCLQDRKRVLGQLLGTGFKEDSRIQLNPHIEADPSALIAQACAMHLEGIVSKNIHSVYRSGRQEDWIKIKCAQTDTFPIIAFVEKLGASPPCTWAAGRANSCCMPVRLKPVFSSDPTEVPLRQRSANLRWKKAHRDGTQKPRELVQAQRRMR